MPSKVVKRSSRLMVKTDDAILGVLRNTRYFITELSWSNEMMSRVGNESCYLLSLSAAIFCCSQPGIGSDRKNYLL